MEGKKSKLATHWWWLDSQSNSMPRKSPWLHSTLAGQVLVSKASIQFFEEAIQVLEAGLPFRIFLLSIFQAISPDIPCCVSSLSISRFKLVMMLCWPWINIVPCIIYSFKMCVNKESRKENVESSGIYRKHENDQDASCCGSFAAKSKNETKKLDPFNSRGT